MSDATIYGKEYFIIKEYNGDGKITALCMLCKSKEGKEKLVKGCKVSRTNFKNQLYVRQIKFISKILIIHDAYI